MRGDGPVLAIESTSPDLITHVPNTDINLDHYTFIPPNHYNESVCPAVTIILIQSSSFRMSPEMVFLAVRQKSDGIAYSR